VVHALSLHDALPISEIVEIVWWVAFWSDASGPRGVPAARPKARRSARGAPFVAGCGRRPSGPRPGPGRRRIDARDRPAAAHTPDHQRSARGPGRPAAPAAPADPRSASAPDAAVAAARRTRRWDRPRADVRAV